MKMQPFTATTQYVTKFTESRVMSFQEYDEDGVVIRTPREMQIDALNAWVNNALRHLFVSACTASGKTLGCKFIFAPELKANKKLRAIIVVPMLNIAGGFKKNEKLNYADIWDFEECEWIVNDALDFSKGNHTQSKVKHAADWLSEPVESNKRVAIMSHVTFTALVAQYGDLLKDLLINVDEVHHSSYDGNEGNGLGFAVDYLLHRAETANIRFLMTTATPARADSYKIMADKFKDHFSYYEYTVKEYFENSDNIKGFTYRFYPTAGTWLELAKEQRHTWFQPKREIRTKTVVFMPGEMHKKVSRKKKHENVENFLLATADKGSITPFDENGVCKIKIGRKVFRVLNLIERNHQKVGMNYLTAEDENGEAINHDNIDIILTVKIFSEGSDWPPANNAVIFGNRRSLVEITQFIGRIFRRHPDKIGEQSIVEIHHALPKTDTDATPRSVYNDMLKCVNLTLMFVTTAMPHNYTIVDDEPCEVCGKNPCECPRDERFNHITEVMSQLGIGAEGEIEKVLEDVAHTINKNTIECEREGGMSFEDINEEAINRVEEMLLDDWNITQDTRLIAECFVAVAIQEQAVHELTGFDVDVSKIPYDMFSKYLASDYYSCGMKHGEFSDWYRDVYMKDEEEAQRRTEWCINFHNEHNRYPLEKKGTTEEERRMGRFLTSQRQNLSNGNGYKSCVKIATTAGHETMFNLQDHEAKAIERCKETLALMKKKGGVLSVNSKDARERSLATNVARMRQANSGTRPEYHWFPILAELAKEAGFPDLYNTYDASTFALERTKELCEFIDKHGKRPATKSKNKKEYDLARFLSGMSQSKKGMGQGVWYPEAGKLAKELGHPDLFDIMTRTELVAHKIKLLNSWYRKHKRIPSSRADNGTEEKKIYQIYKSVQQAKKGMAGYRWYTEYDAVVMEIQLSINTNRKKAKK